MKEQEKETGHSNRIIKFRAWNIQQKKFLDIASLDFHLVESPCVAVMGSEPHRYLLTYPADENILMQFTGLLDSKGKEVFEGDIVKMADWNSPSEFRTDTSHHRIYWDDKGGRWWDERLEDGDSLSGYQDACIDWVSDGIVIGNIYQHPELLKPV